MKNSKKIICALTALIMTVCAAGCGSSENTSERGGRKDTGSPEKTTAAAGAGATDGEELGAAEGETNALAKDAADGDAEIAMEDYAISDDTAAASATAKGDISENGTADRTESINAETGILTAGEWNDNENWGFFANLISSGTIAFPSYGIDPRNRTAVEVKNSGGESLVNAKVQFLDDGGDVLWNAVTDKNGRAYLFCDSEKTAAQVKVTNGGEEQTYDISEPLKCLVGEESIDEDEQGGSQIGSSDITGLVFDGNSSLYPKTEIMFIVDSTGSMADEMLFLQSEFSAIAEEIGTENTYYSVNFYRDEGDEYVTKCSGFTDDIGEIQRSLNSENADGGGDLPEAVAEVMKETITDGEWSEDSVKIAFMIFDAPPHGGTEETLIEATKAASEKGIRIVPVVSSNSDRDTELFARALAICTGGRYIFLTDDSGVGDSHLEPIIGDYKVEKLYDIIIRVINDYRQ